MKPVTHRLPQTTPRLPAVFTRYLPFVDWLFHYRRADLVGDLLAGVIVAIMLVPQGMAYALLAGLPPQVGLYASILPTVIYGLLGTSRTLAVGPVALSSLLVAAGIGQLAPQNSSNYLILAVTLAFMVGLIQILMGAVKLGSLVNFISRPVLSGFTSAAAIIIAFGQLKYILGIQTPRIDVLHELLLFSLQHASQTHLLTLAIGLGSILILIYFKVRLKSDLARIGIPPAWVLPVARSGPLVVVVLGTAVVSAFNFDQRGVAIVSLIPPGLPPFSLPAFDLKIWQELSSSAVTISLIAFLESISVAKSLASKRREKIDANQELIALGSANFGAAFTGGYPVAGGFARSVVNFTVGARTGLASIITAGLIALTLIFLMPAFYYLPKAVLAAIIIVAVVHLIDLATFRNVLRYNKADAVSLLVTFITVLEFGIETGILVGVAITLALYLWRSSRPHIAVVGRVADTEHYRNILRHPVETHADTLAIRVDESLYFANAQYLENYVLNAVADHPQVKNLLLICSAVNFIDASALETLQDLQRELSDAQVGFYLAEVKGPVMDRLQRADFLAQLGQDHVFLSTHQAIQSISSTPPEAYNPVLPNDRPPANGR